MNLYHLKYKWQNHEGSIPIEKEGILYLDLSEPKIRAYTNPTMGPMATLTITKKKIFLNHEGHAYELGVNPIQSGELTMLAEKAEDFTLDAKKYVEKAVHILQPHWKKPVVLGSVGLMLVIFLLIFAFSTKKGSQTKELEMELTQTGPDVSIEELTSRRFRLAQQYLKENNYLLCLDLVDKILAVQPDHREAMKIKEQALHLQDGAKTDAQKILQQELRTKTLLDEAGSSMAKNDYLSAKTTVEQVLEDNPDQAEAHRMKEDIEKELQKIAGLKHVALISDEKKVTEVETLWKNAKTLFEEKKYGQARQLLISAYKTLENLQVKPPFQIDLKELLQKTETHLNEEVRPIVGQARKAHNAGDASTDLSKIRSYQDALKFYFEAEAAFADFPLLQDEINLVLRKLDEALDRHFIEAQTILSMEGCCAAEPYLQKILTLAKYNQVPRYSKAKTLLEQCPCR